MIITNAMKTNLTQKMNRQEGVTLLVALLLVGVLLGVSTSLLNVTLKQYQLSGIALASEMAFQAANAGMECALYHDFPKSNPGVFEVPGDGTEQKGIPAGTPVSITCMGGVTKQVTVRANPPYNGDGDNFAENGEEQNFQFNWGSPEVCVDLSVFKFYSTSTDAERWVGGNQMVPDCTQNSVCTVIQSRGYNVPCSEVGSGTRVVEREYTQVY